MTEPTGATGPSAGAQPTPPAAQPTPPAAQPTPPAAQPTPPGPGPFYQPGFVAPWPPKARWIAPERKVAVIIISAVAAIVLLGIGAVGGSLVAGHHDERFGPAGRHPGYGQRLLPGNDYGRPFPVGPGIPSAPTPTTTS